MEFNLYTAGTRETRERLATAPDFATALRLYESDAAAWAIVPAGEAGELEALGNLESINPRYGSGVYVMRCGDGVSCLGFEYAASKAAAVADWLASEGVPLESTAGEPGTLESFAYYQAAMRAGAAHNRDTGRRCPAELVPALIGLEGKRVEVVDCYGETRRFIVGKSTGWLPCHLEIKSRASTGGGAVTGAPFKSVRVVPGGR